MDTINKRSLKSTFLYMAIIPLLIVGIIIAMVSFSICSKFTYKEVNEGMQMTANTVANSYDAMYPGMYEVVTSDTYMALKKGGHFLTNDYLDNIKIDTGLDITVFYNDIRMLTTVRDSDNVRVLGSKMNSAIKKDVLDAGKRSFYSKVKIETVRYFAYYMPLKNGDDEIVGAICVLRPAKEVNKMVSKSVIPVIGIVIIGIALAVVFIFRYFRKISKSFGQIGTFLQEVEDGNLKAEMDTEVLSRNDEIGRVAFASVGMRNSLRNLVEKDALTALYNRRYSNERLKTISRKSTDSGKPFSVSIGDIDFFKKVNDTYGHDAGDMVLVAVANTLKKFMKEKGFVARWGGEEFLIVFEKSDLTEAEKSLNELLEQIRAIEVPYGDTVIKVTMSYGVTTGYPDDIEKTLKEADDRLYYAKQHGRNQVVAR